jgi:exosortase/archaeosortase family protein
MYLVSATPLTLLTTARDWRLDWQTRWREASPTTRTRVQIGTLLGAVVIAYHYSLRTLIQNLNLDTPLAYIGLVPVIALGLAAVRSRPQRHEPAIHDRQLDYIVGLPLVGAALAINFLMPHRLSTMFWVWRVDLLSLPFFVAGVTAILFGVRALWRQRLAVAYLFLAWPVPYSALLLRELSLFTNVTLSALRVIVRHIHVAAPVAGSDGSVFSIAHHGQLFRLSVVSACSGVNGMVGFLLVGLAFGAAVSGPRLRKTLWMLGGMLLLWLMNLGRLVLIFWAGTTLGEHFSIKVLHPFVGLITFNIGIAVMVLLLKPVGLRIGRRVPTASENASGGEDPVSDSSPWKPLAVPAVYSAISIVVVVGLVLGVHNSALRSYDLVASATGEPKLTSYLSYPASPTNWHTSFLSEFTWAKPYFGESSKWYRYAYTPTEGASDLHSTVPVYADVINSGSLSSFSAYGVEACYRFHGYSMKSVAQVDLGAGITGQSLSYSTKNHRTWSIVYWIWPVKNGSSTRYERVILYLMDTGAGSVSSPRTQAVMSVHGHLNSSDRTQRSLLEDRAFLVSFAHEVITGQSGIAVGSKFATNTPQLPPTPTQNPFKRGQKFVPTGNPAIPLPPQNIFRHGQKWVPNSGPITPTTTSSPTSVAP